VRKTSLLGKKKKKKGVGKVQKREKKSRQQGILCNIKETYAKNGGGVGRGRGGANKGSESRGGSPRKGRKRAPRGKKKKVSRGGAKIFSGEDRVGKSGHCKRQGWSRRGEKLAQGEKKWLNEEVQQRKSVSCMRSITKK